MRERVVVAAIVLAILSTAAMASGSDPAESLPSPSTTSIENEPPADADQAVFQKPALLSQFEFWLAAMVMSFGMAVVTLEFLLIRRSPFSPDEATRIVTVTLIVVGTLFLIVAGLSGDQIAPAMGLFGTIAGYLLGKRAAAEGSAKHD